MKIKINPKKLETFVCDEFDRVIYYKKCINVIHFEVVKKVLVGIKRGEQNIPMEFLKI